MSGYENKKLNNLIGTQINKNIRRIYSMYCPNRKAVLNAAKRKEYKVKVDGTVSEKSFRNKFTCLRCKKEFDEGGVQVDHIIPVGPAPRFPEQYFNGHFSKWFRGLFCDVDNLQVLCKPCHLIKCEEDREAGYY